VHTSSSLAKLALTISSTFYLQTFTVSVFPCVTYSGAALLKGPQNSPVSLLISRTGSEHRVEIMRGIAGKAAQGAVPADLPSITPAAAEKIGAITDFVLFFLSLCSFLFCQLMRF
jgi:hypothetical protein